MHSWEENVAVNVGYRVPGFVEVLEEELLTEGGRTELLLSCRLMATLITVMNASLRDVISLRRSR